MRVILGITGGIAAYKATNIIRLLTEAGHDVRVVPTQNALRFIGATTLEALSKNSVDPDLYTDVESVKHVELGQTADLVIVAPASASFLARYAAGIADDLLGNLLLATKAPVVLAPAMHTEMWQHQATQSNVQTLISRGVKVLEPASGRLTGPDSGVGRLPEAEEIVDFAITALHGKDLLAKKVLVTAGGTREPIDAVRFIGNSSSGKQGIAFANAAAARGAEVTLIAANIEITLPANVKTLRVSTAAELSAAVLQNLPGMDLLVMAAAVADYAPVESAEHKMKKSSIGQSLDIHLQQTQDILKAAVAANAKANSRAVICGFAAETVASKHELEQLAIEKLKAKGADILVANDVSSGRTFGADDNQVLIVANGQSKQAQGSKLVVANEVLDVCSDIMAQRQAKK